MQKILRESQRTTALIDDLLLLARGDAGKETAEPGVDRCGAAPARRGRAGDSHGRGEGHQREPPARRGPLPVRANEAQLRRLLLILVDNALKYTPSGGSVTIAGSSDATQIAISVADTGAGISPEDLPHVFERFWRADKVRSREAGGTGLGLTIAKQIADLHGARSPFKAN